MSEKHRYWLGGIATILLGMTFVVAATGKLMAESKAFDLLAFPPFLSPALSEAIFASLPYIELVVGAILLTGVAIKFAVSLSSLLIIGFATSNILLINAGVDKCASCFGLAGSFTPIASLFFDGIMAILVAVILFCYKGNFFNRTPWFLETAYQGGECGYV